MEFLLITIFVGIVALAEVVCAIIAIKNKSMTNAVENMQQSLLNYQKANTMLTEQLNNERKTYVDNRKLMTIEIGLLKQELQRAKDEGFKVRPELEQEVEVEL